MDMIFHNANVSKWRVKYKDWGVQSSSQRSISIMGADVHTLNSLICFFNVMFLDILKNKCS